MSSLALQDVGEKVLALGDGTAGYVAGESGRRDGGVCGDMEGSE